MEIAIWRLNQDTEILPEHWLIDEAFLELLELFMEIKQTSNMEHFVSFGQYNTGLRFSSQPHNQG